MTKNLKFFTILVFVLGMTAFLHQLFITQVDSILLVIIIGIFAGLMEKYDIQLPNGTIFSGSTILTFAALINFGLIEAMIVEIMIAIFAGLIYRKSIYNFLCEVGMYLLSIKAAGELFLSLDENVDLFTWKDIPIILLSIFTYYLINISLVSIYFKGFTEKSLVKVWLDILIDGSLTYIITSLLIIRLALIYENSSQIQFWIEIGIIYIIFLTLRYAFRLFINLRKTYLNSMEKITKISENNLSLSNGHATRVGRMARQIAESLKLPQEEIDTIHYAALFHDLGKTQLRNHIFNKRGPLTLDEENEYKKHAELSADMVKDIFGLNKAAEYIRYHHENWNGTGFPFGKQEKEIPLGSRIIAAANEYDHLMTKSKVKDPKKEFEKLANQKLDPELVQLILEIADFDREAVQTSNQTSIEDKLIENLLINEGRSHNADSKLLKLFGASLIVTYDGEFRDDQGHIIEVPCKNEILRLIHSIPNEQFRLRQYIQDTVSGILYDVYCFVSQNQIYIIYFDVSHILDYEKKEEEKVKNLYRDVIYSVTQGKLLLLNSEQELLPYYQGELIAEEEIKVKADVSKCRERVQQYLKTIPIQEKLIFNILLCTSEVVTNVLKHATEGMMKVYRDQDTLRIIVVDHGSGINLEELPKSTLMQGYSTKASMGQGFHLILKMMDRVCLNTSSKGTTIILEIHLNEKNQHHNETANDEIIKKI